MLCQGELDHLPEQAFLYVGTIEEAIEKAERLKAEVLRWRTACASRW